MPTDHQSTISRIIDQTDELTRKELDISERHMMDGVVKQCAMCKILKPLSGFYRDASKKDGRSFRCADCSRITDKIRRRKNINYNYQKRWSEVNEYKKKAHMVVNNLVKAGKLKKEPCFFCGKEGNIQGHHLLYEYPDKVVWVCPLHHQTIHIQNRMEAHENYEK